MKNNFSILIVCSFFLVMTSCKSSFEKVRDSGDPDLMLSEADKFFEKGNWLNAQVLYENILGAFRGKEVAERIYFNYSKTYYELRQYLLSSYYFKQFGNTYPNSAYKQDADFMIAFSEYQQSPNFRLDQTPTEEALNAFQSFINSYPTSERAPECAALIEELRAKQEKKAYESALLYLNTRQYMSSEHAFSNFSRDFPNSTRLEDARFNAIYSQFLLAENSIPSKQFERFEVFVEGVEEFKEKYPESNYSIDLEEYYSISNEKINKLANE